MSSSPFSSSLFFQGIPERVADLFSEDVAVWTALDRLKRYLRARIRPNLPGIARPGVPLSSPVVLLPDGWMTDGFEIVRGDASKGRVEIWVGGERIPHASLIAAGAVFPDDQVQIGTAVVVEPFALIQGPTIIGDRTEVRHGAYVRGDCLIGSECVVGHATEIKHSIFLDGAKAGHFAYIGDSVLGQRVNLGAGTKLANLRFAEGNVTLRTGGGTVDTGRRKLGAILGDGVQTGCNSVMNPGTLLGPFSMVAPNAAVKPGLYPPRSIVRQSQLLST